MMGPFHLIDRHYAVNEDVSSAGQSVSLCSARLRAGITALIADIDLLAVIDDSRRISLLDVAGIERQISQMLGHPVELVEEGTLKPRVRRNVEAEAVRAKDSIQRFEDILENITLMVDPTRASLMVEDDLSPFRAAAQRALDLLGETEQ